MKLFTPLYDKCMTWARHQYALTYLSILSFSESMFFPIPPDVMLAPMSLAKPNKAMKYALFTTLASILGGFCGYWLGYFMFDAWVQPLITEFSYQGKFDQAMAWFEEWGIWVIFIAGFSPIPYKVFTIGAGVLNMAIVPFMLASAVGRGMRFYLVAGLMRWGGAKMEEKLKKHIDTLGWGTVVLAVIGYLIFKG